MPSFLEFAINIILTGAWIVFVALLVFLAIMWPLDHWQRVRWKKLAREQQEQWARERQELTEEIEREAMERQERFERHLQELMQAIQDEEQGR